MKSSCPSLPPNSNCKGRSGTSIVFNPVAGRIVYENLARRDIDIPLCIRGYTLSALLCEKFQG